MSRSSGSAARARREAVRTGLAATLALLLVMVAAPALASQVDFRASVDRERVALDETITLHVQLGTESGTDTRELELPEAPDFDVVQQGSSRQSSFSFGIGGSSSRTNQVWTLVLRPRRQGELVILPGKVVVDGRRYETGRITVQVGPPRGGGAIAGGGQAPGRAPQVDPPDAKIGPLPADEKDLFVRTTVDREEAWVGEQITLSVWLYSRMDISHVEGLQMPRLDGFWVEDLESPRQLAARNRMVDGVPYRAYLVQRRALFPLRAGTIEIDPVEIDVHSGGGFFGRSRRYHRASPTLSIEVRELPSGAPAAFRRGNVGAWNLSVEASRQQVAVGEPVTLRLASDGRGNLQHLELPTLGRIDGWKIFDPTTRQEPRVQGGVFGGEKVVEWVLVPERAGTFEIPSLAFAHFDPAHDGYVEIETAPIALTVLPGSGVAQAPGQAPPPEKADEGGLQPLRQAPVIVERREPIHEQPWFLAALLAPALAAAVVAAGPLLRRNGLQRRRRRGREIPALEALRTLASTGDAAFWSKCEEVLLRAAAARLGEPVGGRPRDAICAALADAGVEAATVQELAELLARSEAARFAPGAPPAGAMDEALRRAEQVLAQLEGRD